MNQSHQQQQKRVAQHYSSDSIFDYESVRLSQHATIEFKITTRYLSRLILREAVRVLKQNGLLFAAGINRLAYFREQFRNNPKDVLSRHSFHQQFLQDGNTDPLHAPPIGYAHLTTCEEFRQLFDNDFEQITLTGVESFTSPFPDTANSLSPDELEGWLDLVEATGNTPEGLGMTDHFLYVGRRK